MSPQHPTPRTATASLAYWLLLLCGLAALTVARLDELDSMLSLWLGAVIGTAFGQILAWRRMRLWLVGVIVLNSMWLGALLMMPFWALFKGLADPWMSLQVSVFAFAPAALCGYLALTERGGLAAFWFPAVLWTLAILDRPGGTSLADHGSWLLLSALAVLFLAFLHARETRRLALWRRHATVRISPPRGFAVLREAPLRVIAQAAWLAGLGAATLLLTAWIAPHLWHKDKLPGSAANAPSVASSTSGGADGAQAQAESCCPEPAVASARRERVREYFPLLRTHEQDVAPVPSHCVLCVDGVPPGTTTAVTYPPGTATGTGDQVARGDSPTPPGEPSARYHDSTPSSPTARPAAPTATPTAPPAAPWRSPPPRIVRAPSAATAGPPPSVVAVAVAVATTEDHPFEWPLTLSLVGLALHLALRPLRRLITLRHLGRPLWPETVDQRVSNLWELMLVGLRDAGFHTVPGEPPQELARRVGLEGMKTCADVLERARHGVRVDAADLAAMSAAARIVYSAARRRAGWAARAAAWLRWPLV